MSPQIGSKRLLGLFILAVALVGTAGALQSFDSPSGETVLERTEQRYESADTLTGTATVTVENESHSRTATVQFAMADNQSRTAVTHDNQTYRAGSNGSVVWTVGPNRSAAWDVTKVESRAPAVGDNATGSAELFSTESTDQFSTTGKPALNASNVSATVVGTPTVAGTSTYQVNLTHPETAGTATLWVTQDEYRIVRAVATDTTNRTEISIQETVFNASIHESTFDPPTDRVALTTVDRYDTFGGAQSATDVDLPTLNATFVQATVTTRQGAQVIGQEYTRRGENITILSTTATDRFDRITANATEQSVANHTVQTMTRSDRTIVAWTDDGTTTAVIGTDEEAAFEIVREL